MSKIKFMSNIPTALDFYKEALTNPAKGWAAHKAMKEFAKLHIENVKALMEAKYYAGETGYIIKEEWQELIDNIK